MSIYLVYIKYPSHETTQPGIFIADEGAINARGMRKRIRGCSKGKHVFSRWGRVRYEQEQENTRLFQEQTRLYSFHVGDARQGREYEVVPWANMSFHVGGMSLVAKCEFPA